MIHLPALKQASVRQGDQHDSLAALAVSTAVFTAAHAEPGQTDDVTAAGCIIATVEQSVDHQAKGDR